MSLAKTSRKPRLAEDSGDFLAETAVLAETAQAAREGAGPGFSAEEVGEILDILEEMYPDADCELKFGSIYQLLVAVVLSAQTTDKSVNVVTKDLFEKYPDAFAMAKASEEDIADIIKRIGMYRTKSKNVLALSRILAEKYDGQVPENFELLTELPGVGRKTANVVLSVGFGQPAIAVDTHVFRVAGRIGFSNAKNVLDTEKDLMDLIPKERWSRAHHSLIFHGRRCCTARKPNCEGCGIREYCNFSNNM